MRNQERIDSYRARPITPPDGLDGSQAAEELRKRWAAAGVAAARSDWVQAAAARANAEDELLLIGLHQSVLEDSAANFVLTRRVLRRFRKRRRHEHVMYYLRMALLLLGDVVGITGAAILLGELPVLALLMALAAGAAAVTSGLMAVDVKEATVARYLWRKEASLSEEEKGLLHVFQGPHEGERVAKVAVLGGLTVVLLLMGGVLALRTGTEGALAGVVFGCIAGAVALASWVNCYHYTDPIADLIENAQSDYRRDQRMFVRLTKGTARREFARHEARGTSLLLEHDVLGDAAADRVTSMIDRDPPPAPARPKVILGASAVSPAPNGNRPLRREDPVL